MKLGRQKFLSKEFYNVSMESFGRSVSSYLDGLSAENSDAEDRMLISFGMADDVFANFLLQYSGGVSIDVLRVGIESVVAAFEQSARYAREFEDEACIPPLRFGEISQFEQAMQLIGLCYLLHRRDLLSRIANLFDGAYAAKDTLYEDLLSYELEERFDVDRWYHDKPYRNLINCFYRETPEASIADLEAYLKDWYAAMESAPWHDGHLRMGDDGGGGYFGYWAIEAGAVAYLLELDDSSFRDHIVYPRDLVDYARQLDEALQDL